MVHSTGCPFVVGKGRRQLTALFDRNKRMLEFGRLTKEIKTCLIAVGEAFRASANDRC